jgi:hypothetical protein
LPQTGLSSYVGPALSVSNTDGASSVTSKYLDGSYWTGFLSYLTVSLTGTNVTSSSGIFYYLFLAPVGVITSQYNFVQGDLGTSTGGLTTYGLLGLAYKKLDNLNASPSSVVDAWYASGSLTNNWIAFHACPYDVSSSYGYIDFGYDNESNDTDACPKTLLWTYAPVSDTYYTVTIMSIKVSNVSIELSSSWETSQHSIFDSCTSLILVPLAAYDTLVDDIKTAAGSFKKIVYVAQASVYFSNLPNLTFGSR